MCASRFAQSQPLRCHGGKAEEEEQQQQEDEEEGLAVEELLVCVWIVLCGSACWTRASGPCETARWERRRMGWDVLALPLSVRSAPPVQLHRESQQRHGWCWLRRWFRPACERFSFFGLNPFGLLWLLLKNIYFLFRRGINERGSVKDFQQGKSRARLALVLRWSRASRFSQSVRDDGRMDALNTWCFFLLNYTPIVQFFSDYWLQHTTEHWFVTIHGGYPF